MNKSFISLFLLFSFLVSQAVFASVKWNSILLGKDGKKEEYELGPERFKFFLPKSKWTCFVTETQRDKQKLGSDLFDRETRRIECNNLRDGDMFHVTVKCFDTASQLEANSTTLVDDKNQKFEIFLSCNTQS